MKTTKMLTIYVMALGLILSWPEVGQAAPMGTAFTYQGHLYDANYAANGLYDFEFALYDSNDPCDCNQIGDGVNVPGVDVINAYFTVEIDFNDANAFNGDARWLEIGVRPGDINDPNGYTPLDPRQELTAAPYALHAGTVSAPLKLISEGSPGTAVLSVGSTVEGVAIGCSSPDGDIAVLGKDGTAVWGISPAGYAGFFQGMGYFSGDVGIGTDTPSEKLEVDGTVKATALVGDGSGITNLPPETDPTVLASVKDGVDWIEVSSRPSGLDDGDDVGITVESDPEVGAVDSNYVPKWDGSALVTGTIYDNGNVGIGTMSPSGNLEIESSSNWPSIYLDNQKTGDMTTFIRFQESGIMRWGIGTDVSADDSDNFWIHDYDGGTRLLIDANGNVGIGTTSPLSKLSVGGDGVSNTGVYGSGGYGVFGEGSLYGVYGDGSDYGVYGNSGSGYGVSGYSSSSYGVYGHSGSSYGVYGIGNYGIGVYGKHWSSGNNGQLGGSDFGVKSEGDLLVTGGDLVVTGGDLVVTGAYKGDIGPNNGAPFPRPAYNTGWQSISEGTSKTFIHNIGGNVDDYVVDLTLKDDAVYGIHNKGVGGYPNTGAYWYSLTSSQIEVWRFSGDVYADKVRVRIWVYK